MRCRSARSPRRSGVLAEHPGVHARSAHAFGRPISTFQNTQFMLAECATQVDVGRAYLDDCIERTSRRADPVEGVPMAKWWAHRAAVPGRGPLPAVLRRLRLHARVPGRARIHGRAVQTIYGGTNEIMKVIVAKQLGL